MWPIGSLPDAHGLITVGEAAHHIKVTKTGFRAAVPLPAAWVERYGLGGTKGERRLMELRNRYRRAAEAGDLWHHGRASGVLACCAGWRGAVCRSTNWSQGADPAVGAATLGGDPEGRWVKCRHDLSQ